MKKLLVLLFGLLILSSCNTTVEQPQYPMKLQGRVTTDYQNTVFSADLSYDDESLIVTLVTPAELQGVQIVLNSEDVSVKNGDIVLEYSKDTLMFCPFIQLKCIEELINNQKPVFSMMGNDLISQVDFNETQYKICLDTESKMVKLIQTDKYIFDFYFDEVT